MKYQSLLIETFRELTFADLEDTIKGQFQISTKLSNFNTFIISSEEGASIGIKELSSITEWLNLKNNELRVLIVNSADKLTPEAQNSILKIVEEPPEESLIILVSQNTDKILGTIKSRCLNITIVSKRQADNELEDLARSYFEANYINKTKIVEKLIKDYDNRERIGEFVISVIKILTAERMFDKVEGLETIYKGIKGNVNLKLSLDLLSIYISN